MRLAIKDTIAPAIQNLSNVDLSKGTENVARYAKEILNLDAAQRNAMFTISDLDKTQRQSVLGMAEMANSVRNLTIAQVEQELGMEGAGFATELNAQATDKLTASMLLDLVATRKITAEQAKQLVATNAQTVANTAAAGSFETLGASAKAAMGAMLATPAGWVTLLITVLPLAITLVQKLNDHFGFTADAARKIADESHSAFEEISNDLESVNSELETSKNRLAELLTLSKAGTITIVEQEELDNLQKEIALLEQRQRFLDTQASQQAQKSNTALEKAYGKDKFTDDLYSYERDALTQEREELLKIHDSWTTEDNARYDEICARLTMLGHMTEQATKTNSKLGYEEYVQSLIDRYNELNSVDLSQMTRAQILELDALKARLSDVGISLMDYIDQYEGDSTVKAEWQDIADSIDRVINKAEIFQKSMSELPDTCTQILTELGATGELTADAVSRLANDFPELEDAMDASGSTADEVAAHFNALSTAQDNSTESTVTYQAKLSSLSDVISDLKSSYDALADAQSDMDAGGGLSTDTIEKLAKENENYLDYLYEENGVIKLNTEAWKENTNAKMQSEMAEIQKEIDSLNERNKALLESIAYFERMKDTDSNIGMWDQEIAKTRAEIEKNTGAVKKNQDLLALYNGIFKQIRSGSDDAFSSLTDRLTSITSKYDLLTKAQEEFSDSGILSASTLSSIADKFPEMEESVSLYIAGLKTSQELLEDLSVAYGVDYANYESAVKAKLRTSEAFYNSLTNDQKQLISELSKSYGIDLDNFKTIEEKKLAFQAEIIKQLAANYSKYAGASLEELQDQYDNAIWSGGLDRAEVQALGKAISAIEKYNKTLNSIASGVGLTSVYNPKNIKSSSGSSSSSSKKVEEYTATIDAHREALERLRQTQERTADVERRIEQAPYMRIVPQEELDALDTENKQLLERNELLEEALGAVEYYNEVQQEISELGIDTNKSVFGNIDLNNRQVLEWTDEMLDRYRYSIESWGDSVEDMAGTVSTVLGTWNEFDGVPIAFSPMLQTENGPVYLDADTAHEYIWALIDKAGEGWHSEDLLRLDTEGLEFDGQIIKNLIADIGDTAEHTAESMHYLGTDGAINDSYSELSYAADQLGVSIDGLISQYDALNAEYDRNEEQVDSNQAALEGLANTARNEFDVIRKQIELRKELIKSYEEQQDALHNLNNQRDATITAGVQSLRNLGFEVQYNADTNYLWISNMERLNELVADSKGEYDTLQEATNALRKETEDLIGTLEDLNEENREGSSTWWDLKDSIKDAKIAIVNDLQEIVDQASDAVDEIQSVADTLYDAADEFAANDGFITIDTWNALRKVGAQYMQLLKKENNEWEINEERINAVIAARTRQLAVENAMSYVERLKLAAQEGSVENLNDLIFVTTDATNSTWGLVYAELELMHTMGDLNDSQYQVALHNIQAMQDLAENAIQNIGKATDSVAKNLEETRKQLEATKKGLQDTLDELEDMQDGAGDLVDYVMDMLKHRIQQQIGLLEEMKDKYSEIIDLKKKSLDATKDEQDYQKTIAKKLKEMAKIQERINALSLDDSRSAQAERAKLLEQMAELQEDLADTQADKSIEAQKEALDKMEEDYHAEKDEEIKILENSISSTQKLYNMAISYIRDNWDTLYSELISWNTEYGTSLNSEIDAAWEAAQAAAQRYGDFVSAIMGGISGDIDRITQQIKALDEEMSNLSISASPGSAVGSVGSSGNAESDRNTVVGNKNASTTPTNEEMVRTIVGRMKELSAAWSSDNDPNALHEKAVGFARQMDQYGVHADYRDSDGTWWISQDKLNPNNIGKLLYSCYHTGGFVGDKPLKPDERYIKAKDGELVLTSDQQDNFAAQIDRIGAMTEKFMDAPMLSPISAVGSRLSQIEHNTINNITNNSRPIEINVGSTIIQGNASVETVAAHEKVTEKMVNEFARLVGVKW